MAVAAAGASAATCAAGGRAPVAKPAQELAILLAAHRVVSSPGDRATAFATVAASRPITGEQTVLPVLGAATAADGTHWLHVMLPGRPNGLEGWITERGTAMSSTVWRLVVKTSTRRVLVFRRGVLVRDFAAIVGKPSTPTPRGRFFVEESVLMPPSSAGAPFALALSARSAVLQQFDGGPGQIAIHGLENLGGTPGTAISHGCVRLGDRGIRWLAARIAPGVPVTITT